MHQPFLRLGNDLGSLEIIGPRQDASLLAASGLTWVVNGRRFPTLRNEEFIDKITDEARVAIEPHGLAGTTVSPRHFTLRLDDRTEPFILFDERTRKERRISGLIPAGAYWLLHRSRDDLKGTEQRYDWPDGQRALSYFHARPGVPLELECGDGRAWQFTAAVSPFFEALGESLVPESQEPVCFGWSELPSIWIPVEHAEPGLIENWQVRANAGGTEYTWNISPTSDQAGGMVKCRIESGEFLQTLPPAMYRLAMTLNRPGRARSDANAEYWLWQGLRAVDVRGFHLLAAPQNVVREECRGFDFQNLAVFHKRDQHRRHILSFDICGSLVAFEWSQSGVFLDSLDRRPGERSQTRPHHLGDVFSASLDSVRWLRLWLAGESGWAVLVSGRVWQRAVGDDRRDLVEFSLANLALAFPEGGEIRLRVGAGDPLVARFSSPLKPIAAEFRDDVSRRGFRFHFTETTNWVRPAIWDLSTGRKFTFPGQNCGICEQCKFVNEQLPQLEFIAESEASLSNPGGRHFITLWVPKLKWPGGLWLIELEVRRDEESEWQSVLVNGREYAPIVVRAAEVTATVRSTLLGVSLRPILPDTDIPAGPDACEALIELLVDLIVLRKREFVMAARQDMGWLKDALRTLSQAAGRLARQPSSEGFQQALLNLACQDSQHAGFVYLPELLALPASEYCELPAGDPLNEFLRRCGRLALADSIASVVRTDFGFLDINVLGCFVNFATVANDHNPESDLDFASFAYEKYWQDVVGTIDANRIVADWTGDAALGKAHTLWAFGELVKRYETSSHDLKVAAANTLLHLAPLFRGWLSARLKGTCFASASAHKAPWLRFVAPETDFLEAVPRFAFLFALAARASAAGIVTFDETLIWLESQVERRYMAEEGIAALVGLAPELFGHQLVFWELMVRTTQTRGV